MSLTRTSALKNITNVLSGINVNTEHELELPEDLSTENFAFFKYAPITSVDVERSLSMYNTLISDNQRLFTFVNLSKHLIIQCNLQGEKHSK